MNGRVHDTVARALDRCSVEENGCWVYNGGHDKHGYPQLTVTVWFKKRVCRYLHCWVWEFFEGPVPNGLELDHLCRNRACVNPGHHEAVTHQINGARMTEEYKDVLRVRIAEARKVRWA